jgi:hypothetical protein
VTWQHNEDPRIHISLKSETFTSKMHTGIKWSRFMIGSFMCAAFCHLRHCQTKFRSRTPTIADRWQKYCHSYFCLVRWLGSRFILFAILEKNFSHVSPLALVVHSDCDSSWNAPCTFMRNVHTLSQLILFIEQC